MPANPHPPSKSTSIILGIFCALVAIFAFEAIDSHASFHIDFSGLGDDRVRLNVHDDDVRLRLDRKGIVQIADDGRIERADVDASLEIEDRSRQRSLLIVGRDGDPEITYRQGRNERAFDADARTWLAEMMQIAYRRGGLDADRRIEALLEDGVGALLDEAQQIDGDHVLRRYLESALDAEPTGDDLARVLDVAARRLDGDHEQMVFLRQAPVARLNEPAVRDAFVRAVTTIDGDHSLRQVLEPLLSETSDRDLQTALLAVAAKTLDGDHDASQLLARWAESGHVQPPLPEAAYRLLSSIDGDHASRVAAVALVEALPTSEMPQLIERADAIGGDYDLRQFLIHVAEHHLDGSASVDQEALRASIERAMARLGGEHDRELVERALDRS